MAMSHLTSSARLGASAIDGDGVICVEPVAAGELVAAFAGRCITRAELVALPIAQRRRCVQIDEDLYLAESPGDAPAAALNHSCEPNCALRGQVVVVARRTDRARAGAHHRLRHAQRQRRRRVRVQLRHDPLPRQGDRPRLDAPGAARALPRHVQPVPRWAHRRARRVSRQPARLLLLTSPARGVPRRHSVPG